MQKEAFSWKEAVRVDIATYAPDILRSIVTLRIPHILHQLRTSARHLKCVPPVQMEHA